MLLDYEYLDILDTNISNNSYKRVPNNTSILYISDNKYLCLVKEPLIYTNEVIPDNSNTCTNLNITKNINKNFFWGRWGAKNIIYKTTLYLKDNNILSPISFSYNKIKDTSLLNRLHKYHIDFNDMRIAKINNKIYMYDNYLFYVLECEYANNNLDIINYKKVRSGSLDKGKNFTPIEITDEYITYLDWFYGDYVLIVKKYYNSTKEEHIKISLNSIPGLGSCLNDNNITNKFYGRIPGFSFSTPLVKLNDTSYLGVGHIKIRNPEDIYKYSKNSNIEKFRNKLHKDMKKKYKDNYKIHLGYKKDKLSKCTGYIYTMYFFILTLVNNNYKLYISDSYLPVNFDKKHKDKYKFSLIFPMGLEIQDSKILVSCGEGDYYPVILTFDLDKVIKLKYYDVEKLDMDKYNYYIIKYKDNKCKITSSLYNRWDSYLIIIIIFLFIVILCNV